MSCDDVRVFGEVLGVFQLSLKVASAGVVLADGLDDHSLASHHVLGNPCGAVGSLACLFQESVALVEAHFDCHFLSGLSLIKDRELELFNSCVASVAHLERLL